MKTGERKYSINEQTIKKAMEKTRGYITARQANYLGVSGGYLKQMANKGVIEKVGRGIYMDSLEYPDGFHILNMQCPKIIFSHLTALSFYEMSEIDPYNVWDITIPYGYHDDRLCGHSLHCVKKDIFELGLTSTKTIYGNWVRAYNPERCICDIIKNQKKIDFEYVKYSVREYLSRKDKNLSNLVKYSQILGIEMKVMSYINLVRI